MGASCWRVVSVGWCETAWTAARCLITSRCFGFRYYRAIRSGLGERSLYRTRCGLDGPGFAPKGSKKFYLLYACPYRPTEPPLQWVTSLSGAKLPGRGVHYPPPCNIEVKYDYSYTTFPPLCASNGMLRGDCYFHFGQDSGLVQMLPIKFLPKFFFFLGGGHYFFWKINSLVGTLVINFSYRVGK